MGELLRVCPECGERLSGQGCLGGCEVRAPCARAPYNFGPCYHPANPHQDLTGWSVERHWEHGRLPERRRGKP